MTLFDGKCDDILMNSDLKDVVFSALVNKSDIAVALCEFTPVLNITYGNDHFYELLGADDMSYQTMYGAGFMDAVKSSDRLDFKQKLKKAAKGSGEFNCELHLRRGEDSAFLASVSVMTGSDDKDHGYAVVLVKDIDKIKATEKELHMQSVRYHVLKKITNEPVFEYDDLTDTCVISFQGEDKDTLMIHNYRKNIRESKIIAAEDVEQYIEEFDASLDEDSLSIHEYRTNLFDNEYTWYRAVYTTIYDDDTGVVKLVGKMENIDADKKKQHELLEKAMFDPMTKLYNKVATRHKVEEYIDHLPDSQHALMIVDIDNFKMVNDNLGHLFGDTVLINFAEELKRVFNEDEVVGRIGGDEFIVFLPETTREEIEKKATMCCHIFDHVYSGNLNDINVSTSIGISFYPEDAGGYEALFRASDQALYVSKQGGKNQYNFYNPEQQEDVLATSEEELKGHYKMENSREKRDNQATQEMIEFSFHIMTETKDIISGIGLVLESLCKRLNVRKAMLFEENTVGNGVNITFGWDNVNGVSSNKEKLRVNLQEWMDLCRLLKGRSQVLIDDVNTLENIKTVYKYLNYTHKDKVLLDAVKDDDAVEGMLVLIANDCDDGEGFNSDEKNMVRVIMKIVNSYLLQVRMNDRVNKKIDRLTNYDVVTGRYHFEKFKSVLREMLDWDEVEKDENIVIVYSDISEFKNINDIYGYSVGDQVLYEFSEILRNRKGFKLGCRDYADHFITAFSLKKDTDMKKFILDMEYDFNKKQNRLLRHTTNITSGVYIVSDISENVSRMIDKANIARKVAKHRTSHNYKIYDEPLEAEYKKNQTIESRMENALQHGEFKVFMQPKIDLATGRIVAAEALTRWQKPDLNYMVPDDFIPVFEKNGFITQVDFYVLEVVCKTIRERIREHQVNVNISVNQSRYLLHDEEYVSKIRHMIDRYEIPPELLDFELTESLFFEDSKAMIDIMHQLKKLNVLVSIDDFGSGYSSLNVLKDVPADIIKIDKEFLNDTEDSKDSEIIIQKTVEMAKELNKKVICEGVETLEQVEFLKSIGCDMVQGYYYAKPMPLEDFYKKLEAEN